LSKAFIIGARGSLLSVTQSTLIKNELEAKTGHKFEIKKIKTQGDLQTEKPLWQMDGKDFFTKELDTALLKKEIDLVIHSYKDLGSVRPKGIHLAAITERSFPHDILLIKKTTVEKISSMKELKVGTSSPRRIVNIEARLGDFIPADNIKVSTQMLRGNVNTRVQKLRDDKYDAIILAFAGLERLTKLPDAKKELEALLEGLTFMILPQSEFPSAASQGALGIECHEDNNEMKELLSCVHHDLTAQAMKIERERFQSYGGGCHLAVGIHARKIADKWALFEKGNHNEKQINEKKFLNDELYKKLKKQKAFLGLPKAKLEKPKAEFIYDELLVKKPVKFKTDGVLFSTATYASENLPKGQYLFTSGLKNWKKCNNLGHWVHGSSESIGHSEIEWFQQSDLIKILTGDSPWKILTHKDSENKLGQTIEAYSRERNDPSDAYKKSISECEIFYWTSYFQYLTYKPLLNSKKSLIHCCGTGKTLEEFTQNGIEVYPVLDMKKWVNFFTEG
jgi:hydroxymethylbilane synthase